MKNFWQIVVGILVMAFLVINWNMAKEKEISFSEQISTVFQDNQKVSDEYSKKLYAANKPFSDSLKSYVNSCNDENVNFSDLVAKAQTLQKETVKAYNATKGLPLPKGLTIAERNKLISERDHYLYVHEQIANLMEQSAAAMLLGINDIEYYEAVGQRLIYLSQAI